jgi:uncharacterized membrane protein YphA (DoxX/SURF4 family)
MIGISSLSSFHVDYVTQPEPAPDPLRFVLDTLSRSESLIVLGAGVAVTLAVLLAWAWLRPLDAARLRFVERAATYQPLVPWMARLSVGLVLIGAGLSRRLFVPIVDAGPSVGLALTAIGFLLLLGLAVRPAAALGLAIYLVGLVVHPELSLIFDVAGGLVAVALLGPGTPSLDDLLRASFPSAVTRPATVPPRETRYDDLVPLLVRIGLGGAFVISGIVDKLVIYPQALEAVAKYGLTDVVPVPAELWVVGAGLIETSLGLAILLGVMTRFSAIVGFAVLSLALFALPDDPVIAHVGLFGLSSILVVLGAGRWSVDRLLLSRLSGAGA